MPFFTMILHARRLSASVSHFPWSISVSFKSFLHLYVFEADKRRTSWARSCVSFSYRKDFGIYSSFVHWTFLSQPKGRRNRKEIIGKEAACSSASVWVTVFYHRILEMRRFRRILTFTSHFCQAYVVQLSSYYYFLSTLNMIKTAIRSSVSPSSAILLFWL